MFTASSTSFQRTGFEITSMLVACAGARPSGRESRLLEDLNTNCCMPRDSSHEGAGGEAVGRASWWHLCHRSSFSFSPTGHDNRLSAAVLTARFVMTSALCAHIWEECRKQWCTESPFGGLASGSALNTETTPLEVIRHTLGKWDGDV